MMRAIDPAQLLRPGQLDTPKDWILYVITGQAQGRNAAAVTAG